MTFCFPFPLDDGGRIGETGMCCSGAAGAGAVAGEAGAGAGAGIFGDGVRACAGAEDCCEGVFEGEDTVGIALAPSAVRIVLIKSCSLMPLTSCSRSCPSLSLR